MKMKNKVKAKKAEGMIPSAFFAKTNLYESQIYVLLFGAFTGTKLLSCQLF